MKDLEKRLAQPSLKNSSGVFTIAQGWKELATKLESLSLTPGTYTVKRENPLQAAFWTSYTAE